jgi:hypothetical protein
MPFIGKFTNASHPTRVYALCKLVQDRMLLKEDLSDYLQPPGINSGKGQFNEVYRLAMAGELIRENADGKVESNLSAEETSSPENFRYAVVKRVLQMPDFIFCRFTSWYLMRGKKVLTESNDDLVEAYDKEMNLDKGSENRYNSTNIPAWKSWASYSGYGYMHKGVLIPNVYVRLRDEIQWDRSLTKGKSISFAHFMRWLNESCPELDGGSISKNSAGSASMEGQQLSFSLSLGLRTLHDQGNIRLHYTSDALDTWFLTESRLHDVKGRVSEITILEKKVNNK